MSARSRLIRLCSVTVVSAFIAGAAMLTAPTAYAVDSVVQDTVQAPTDEQAASAGTPDASTDVTGIPADTSASNQADPPAASVVSETTETATGDEASTGDTTFRDNSAMLDSANEDASVDDAAATSATEIAIAEGALSWGVKQSFRNYIYNFAMFEGRSTLLGTTVAQPDAKGAFTWAQGTGIATNGATQDTTDITADVSFGVGAGVHFQSHPMDTGNGEAYALDLAFTNPRVLITSPTTGELRLDVSGREFIDPTSVGAPFSYTDVVFATLDLPQATTAGGGLTWTAATATLTQTGSEAFGGFYQAGETLDPVTFSTIGGTTDTSPNPNPNPDSTIAETSVTLAASKTEVATGEVVTLTATIAPKTATGTVQFFNGTTKLGDAARATDGAATHKAMNLPVGTHEISAEFTPTDPAAFAGSRSAEPIKLRVSATAVSGDAANATLSWGVKESFRNYVVGPIAAGTITMLGSTNQASRNGVFNWTGGTGTATSNGSKANVTYGEGNGLHLRGHSMGAKNQGPFALDLALTNPRVVVTSATQGEIRIDVAGREFAGMNDLGKEINLKQVVVATLNLPSPSANGKTLTWNNAPATLTTAGSKALGAFYPAGEALDPATFSLAMGTAVTAKKPTEILLKASATTVKHGAAVTLTASAKPNLAGTVVFSSGGKQLGGAMKVVNGQAKTTIKPAAGAHAITASFTPASDSYGRSVSNTVKLTVEKKPDQPSITPPKGAQAAGSLNWGVSTAFADYVTGPIAKGRVTTSGVGASGGVYLFPQTSRSSWNATTHTGSVQYSGTVTYEGHKGLLREGVTDPRIDVTGPTTAVLYSGGARWATLDLGAATKSVGANGEVTWSGVPVNGGFTGGAGGGSSYSLPADGLSFTVGAASGVSFGSTSVSNADKKRTVAETAPTTTGIRILTAPDQIAAGAELEFEAEGFETSEREMIVAMYPGPIVLDEAAGANGAGTVRWLGTLPEDLAPGEYTITVQGSTDAGAVITVLEEKASKAAKQEKRETEALLADGVDAGALAAAGVAPLATGPVWLWWVGAGSLLIIASAMGGLVALQRRAGAQP